MNKKLERATWVASLMLGAAAADAAEYEITWFTIDGGGAMNGTGGPYRLSGTIGQCDAGEMSGGAINLSVLCIQSSSGESAASIRIVAGRASTRSRAAGWSKRTAPQIRRLGAPPSPWRRIS